MTFKEYIDSRQFDEALKMVKNGEDLLKSQFQFKLSDAFPAILQNNAFELLTALVENDHIELDIFEYDSFRDTVFGAIALHCSDTPEAISFLDSFIPEVDSLNDSLEDITWLGMALKNGAPPAIVESMIDSGCDINYLDNNDANLLFTLLGSNHRNLSQGERRQELFQLLVDRGVDINRANKVGETVLHIAMQNQQKELVLNLLEHGADPNLANHQGETAYSICMMTMQDAELCKQMMDLYPLDLQAETGQNKSLLYRWLTRLYSPTLGEKEQYFLQIMAENGADPYFENINDYGDKETAWDIVVQKNNDFFNAFLGAFDADINRTDNLGNTLLHKVCAYNVNFDQAKAKEVYRKAKTLIKLGADPSLLNTADQSPIDLASQDNLKEKTVALLLKNNDC